MADTRISAISTTRTDSTIDADGEYLIIDKSGGTTARALVDDVVLAGLAQTASTVAIASDLNVDSGTLFVDVSANSVGIGSTALNFASSRNGVTLRANSANGVEFIMQSQSVTDGTTGGFAFIAASTDAYIYNRQNGFLSLATNNTERVRIDSSGNVGIGTNSPGAQLEVQGSGSTTGVLIDNTATDGDPYLAFGLSGSATFTLGVDDGDSDKFKIGTTAIGSSTRLTIDSTGNVGIGTTSPTFPASRNGMTLRANSANGVEFIMQSQSVTDETDGGFAFIAASTDAYFWNRQNGFLAFATNNTERVRIDSSGNVGIGTTSPSVKMQVAGAIAITDGMTAPSTVSGYAVLYVDSSDGDLKVKFSDGTVKTIMADT